jgi:hypothetical protein
MEPQFFSKLKAELNENVNRILPTFFVPASM